MQSITTMNMQQRHSTSPRSRLQKYKNGLLMAATLALLAACATTEIARAPTLQHHARWALLPFVNQTETPQAGLRAESIAESLMRSDGIVTLKHYPAGLNTETLFEPMDRKQFDAALAWARNENIQYAVTGSVEEWRYKVGIDGEPAVGVTLQLIDVQSGDVLWSATGGKTGWSRESLSGVAQKLMAKLLSPVTAAGR